MADGQDERFYTGEEVTFKIKVFNQGTLAASNIELRDYVPAGLELSDNDWTLNNAGDKARITLNETVQPGEMTMVEITFIVTQDFAGQIVNRAEIFKADAPTGFTSFDVDSTPDNNPGNDSGGEVNTDNDDEIDEGCCSEDGDDEDDADPEDITVEVFDLALRKTLADGQADAFYQGDQVIFNIEIFNQGTVAAQNIVLADPTPTGLELVGSIPSIAGPLAPGDSEVVSITYNVTADFEGTIENRAEIASAEDDLGDEPEDIDSTPGTDPTDDTEKDDVIDEDGKNNPGDDEDDADVAVIDTKKLLSVGSTVFADNNNNGIQDPGEDGISGVTVEVFSAGPDGLFETADDVLEGSDVTDADGNYFIDGLRDGDYYAKVPNPDGDYPVSSGPTDTADNQEDGDDNGIQNDTNGDGQTDGATWTNPFTLSQGDEPTGAEEDEQGGDQDDADDSYGDMTIDFGFVPLLSIGSNVFVDNNDNGVRDNNEPGIEGVTVMVFNTGDDGIAENGDDELVGTDVTDADGNYFVDGLVPGDYYVKVTPDTDYPQSSTDIGSTANPDDNEDNDDNGLQPDGKGADVWSNVVTLTGGDEPTGADESGEGGDQDDGDDADGNMTVDFGFLPELSIGSNVFVDNNDNGIRDNNEPGIEGVTVMVFNTGDDGIAENGDDELVGTDVTDADGNYFVDG